MMEVVAHPEGGEEVQEEVLEVEVPEDLEGISLRRFSLITKYSYRGCLQMCQRKMWLSSLALLEPSRMTGRLERQGYSCTQTETQELLKEKERLLTKIHQLRSKLFSGSTVRSSIQEALSRSPWQ